MRKIEVVRPDRDGAWRPFTAPHCRAEGFARSRPASPAGASIWMQNVELEAGTRLVWEAGHRDEGLYVEAGELAVGGRRCGAGGALVVEGGGTQEVEVLRAARVLHMGPAPRNAESVREGAAPFASSPPSVPPPVGARAPKVHVVGPRGVFETLEPGRETRFFADATCPGCSLWLLYTARTIAYESPVHTHTQDELVHVLHGEIRVGSLAAGPGETIFVAANQPYQFRAEAGGFGFLNYRRAPSQMTIRATGQRIVEAGAATGMSPVAESLELV
jgi:hypothetical protein